MPGLPIIPFLLGALAASTAAESAPPGQPGAEEARRSPDSGGAAEASHPFSTVVIDRRDRSTAQADPAAAGSVVTLDRAPRSGETLADLVSELPGVAVNRLGGLGGLALMSVRGSTWEQVRVLVDGVPLNSAAGGGVDLSSIPLSDIERIEVYRGSSPLELGSSALGGIVSITTRSPRRTQAVAQAGRGSFEATLAAASSSLASSSLGAFLGASWESALNDFPFFSNGGTAFDPGDDGVVRRENAAYRQMGGTARLRWKLPRRREIALAASALDRRQGLPGFGLFPTADVSLRMQRFLTALSYLGRDDLGFGGKLRALLTFSSARTRFGDPLGEIAVGGADTNDTIWSVGFSAHAQRRVGFARLGGLAEVRSEHFLPRDALRDPPAGAPGTRFSFAAGAESAFHLAALSLEVTPSLRLEGSRDIVSGRVVLGGFAPAAPAVWRSQPIARLSFIQFPHRDWSLKANVGRYARFANFNELYGDSGFIRGNPDLRPESGTTGDLGAAWRQTGGAFAAAAEVFVFANIVADLIQYEQSGYGVSQAENVGRARIFGAEALVSAELGPYLRVSGQLTYTDARDTTRVAAHASKQLPQRPRVHAFGRAELRRVPLHWGLAAGASVELDATGGNYLDPSNLIALPPRVLLGASASLAWSRHARLTVTARNLSDSRISDFGGYPLPGRSLFATLSLFTHDPNEP